MSINEIPERVGGWTIPQYADHWQVHRATVHNWLKEGKLGSIKVGATRRITPEHDAELRKRFNSAPFA